MGWVHAYNAHGPDALAFRRTGGRRPFFARTAQPNSARRSAPLSARPRRRPEPGLIQRRAGRCAALSLGPARGSGGAVARRSARPCTASSCRGRKSWKKAKKLLGRADPERRQAFIERVRDLLAGAQRDQHLVVFLDEAHIHQDADLGYGWAERGQRFLGNFRELAALDVGGEQGNKYNQNAKHHIPWQLVVRVPGAAGPFQEAI